jgi:coenzyme PQQ precursor peptide PqqA
MDGIGHMAGPITAFHENHEGRIMSRALGGDRSEAHTSFQVEIAYTQYQPHGNHKVPCHPPRRHDMAWQKPQATDLRYGFEITMYISNR